VVSRCPTNCDPHLPTLLRRLLAAALLIALTYAALPWLDLAWYAFRLSTMPQATALAMPVAALKPRALKDTWHAARPPNRRHEGIDIFAEKGTPVLAATEGILLRLEETPIGGKVAWVLGPAGHQHYYAHLDQFGAARPGDRVRTGTLLGYIGNTGNAKTTPPHLHYGVYADQGAINPYPLLTAPPL
jgi:murein DD-endopeptidase MepM/ murein hydrolase activator NlpD